MLGGAAGWGGPQVQFIIPVRAQSKREKVEVKSKSQVA